MQLLSDPSFLPALFKPKLHGAAYGKGIYLSPISSISFGYSGRNDSFLATQHPSGLFCHLFYPPCELSALCVCNMAWSSSWKTSHMWEMLSVLLLLCVVCPFGVQVSDLLAEFVCLLPYHTSFCGCVKWGCQWIFVQLIVGFLHCLDRCVIKLNLKAPYVLLLKHSLVADFGEPCQTSWFWCWLMT